MIKTKIRMGEGLGGKNKQQAPNMSRRAPHWALGNRPLSISSKNKIKATLIMFYLDITLLSKGHFDK